MPSWSCLNSINISDQLIPPQELCWIGAKKGRASISPRRVTHSERATARMTASFQRSHRDGPVRGLVFRQGCLALHFSHSSTDKCHSQRSGRCRGAWHCSSGESDSIWQCAFSPSYHPPRLRSCHPNTSLSSLHTTKSAVFAVSPHTPHFSSLLSSQRTHRA